MEPPHKWMLHICGGSACGERNSYVEEPTSCIFAHFAQLLLQIYSLYPTMVAYNFLQEYQPQVKYLSKLFDYDHSVRVFRIDN